VLFSRARSSAIISAARGVASVRQSRRTPISIPRLEKSEEGMELCPPDFSALRLMSWRYVSHYRLWP
jgi:hypothetical protein